MSKAVADQPLASNVRKSGSGSDHCEAVLTLSGRVSSDVSATSSIADDLQRAPGSPQTRPGGVSESPVPDKGATTVMPQAQPGAQCPPAPSPTVASPQVTAQQPTTSSHLNILVIGASNLGKTRFIAELIEACGGTRGCDSHLATKSGSPPRSPERRPAPLSTALDHHPGDFLVHLAPLELPGSPGRKLHVSLLDAPAYDAEPNQALYLAKLLEYILWQQEKDFRKAIAGSGNSPAGGPQSGEGRRLSHAVSLCLYFLPPSEDVSSEDLAFMSALSQEVPLLPVVAVGAARSGGPQPEQEEEEEDRIAGLQRAVLGAMAAYVRDGKSAPIKPLVLGASELGGAAVDVEGSRRGSVLVYGSGPDGPPQAAQGPRQPALELFRALLHPAALAAVMGSAAERYDDFCQRYEAYGHDAMCLLAELLEPYDKTLHHAGAASAAAAAAAAPAAGAPDRNASNGMTPSASKEEAGMGAEAEEGEEDEEPEGPETPGRIRAPTPPPPTTPELMATGKPRERDASAGSAPATAPEQEQGPEMAAALAGAGAGVSGSQAAPGGAVAEPAGALGGAQQLPVAHGSELAKVVTAIEGIVTKLTAERVEEDLEEVMLAAVHGHRNGHEKTTGRAEQKEAAAPPPAPLPLPPSAEAARGLTSGDAEAVHSAVHRALTAAVASVVASENAALVHDTVHRAVTAVLAQAAAADDAAAVHASIQRAFKGVNDAAVVHDVVHRALQAAIARAADDKAVHDAVQRVFEAVIASAAAASKSPKRAALATSASWNVSSGVHAVNNLLRQSLAAAYASLAAATSAVQHATAGLYSPVAAKAAAAAATTHAAPEDGAAVVHAVVQRAVAAVLAEAAAAEAEAAAAADPVAAMVKRVVARVVGERAEEVEATVVDKARAGRGTAVRVRASSGSAAAAATGVAPRKWPLLGSGLLASLPASAAARRKDMMGYITGLLGPPAGSAGASGVAAEGDAGESSGSLGSSSGGGRTALQRNGLGLGLGLGVGVAGLAAATVVVIAIRQRQGAQAH